MLRTSTTTPPYIPQQTFISCNERDVSTLTSLTDAYMQIITGPKSSGYPLRCAGFLHTLMMRRQRTCARSPWSIGLPSNLATSYFVDPGASTVYQLLRRKSCSTLIRVNKTREQIYITFKIFSSLLLLLIWLCMSHCLFGYTHIYILPSECRV